MSSVAAYHTHRWQPSALDTRFSWCRCGALERPIAHARHTDPITSHEAAASVTGIRASQQAVLALFDHYGLMCDEQLIAHALYRGVRQSQSGLRSRRAELVVRGLLVDTGRTVLTAAGRRTIVWAKA